MDPPPNGPEPEEQPGAFPELPRVQTVPRHASTTIRLQKAMYERRHGGLPRAAGPRRDQRRQPAADSQHFPAHARAAAPQRPQGPAEDSHESCDDEQPTGNRLCSTEKLTKTPPIVGHFAAWTRFGPTLIAIRLMTIDRGSVQGADPSNARSTPPAAFFPGPAVAACTAGGPAMHAMGGSNTNR